ncbi:PREDICTED: LOW QUALITY PROTEIN: interferon-induced protein with tetratricopeptide repeats 1-like [Phaethon lepturus]|uniref:LOW QUALITY PROTEIN: interferon-induced protein with tetratricopeptide repeats 1-like n=1 Tax=Phaethon lepturus TaxID=97097 RepID=UPI000530AE77|nr:PREDICTED: LOW QUALITY PROTEIN: interferon-induced protein with tetratricopeptide repeats 1-like [Phaethon lepturus]
MSHGGLRRQTVGATDVGVSAGRVKPDAGVYLGSISPTSLQVVSGPSLERGRGRLASFKLWFQQLLASGAPPSGVLLASDRTGPIRMIGTVSLPPRGAGETVLQSSNEQLKEKLDALQCHFTWHLGVTGHVEPTPLFGLQAYLYQLKGQSREALQSLKDAEEHETQDEQQASTADSSIICGNYAWIHYLQGSYQEAKSYLKQIEQLCPTPWDAQLIPYIQAQKGWSLLAIRTPKLLEQVQIERSIGLIEESAEKSSDPDVLKASALFWLQRSTERAMEILQRALKQDPSYHLLYQSLGKCYKIQWLTAKQEDKNNILEAAIKHLKQILQKHPDLDLVFLKLQLAELYGAIDPAQEEKIYKELQERKDTLSPKGHQALNLYWGNFFLYKKKSLDEAKAKFMEGYKIPMPTEQRKECARKLTKVAWHCHSNDADAIHRFIQKTDHHLPAEFFESDLD